MEEKERYELFEKNDIIDTEYCSSNEPCSLMSRYQTCVRLNQQDKENEQLKQQLYDLPKNILKDIQENFDWKQCCEIRKYYDQQYIWFNYVAFNDFLESILKKYGGENE